MPVHFDTLGTVDAGRDEPVSRTGGEIKREIGRGHIAALGMRAHPGSPKINRRGHAIIGQGCRSLPVRHSRMFVTGHDVVAS